MARLEIDTAGVALVDATGEHAYGMEFKRR